MSQQQVTRGKPRPLDISKRNQVGSIPAPTVVVSAVQILGGNITAHAGVNLNTSLLALEKGNTLEIRKYAEQAYLRDLSDSMNALMSGEQHSGNRGFEVR